MYLGRKSGWFEHIIPPSSIPLLYHVFVSIRFLHLFFPSFIVHSDDHPLIPSHFLSRIAHYWKTSLGRLRYMGKTALGSAFIFVVYTRPWRFGSHLSSFLFCLQRSTLAQLYLHLRRWHWILLHLESRGLDYGRYHVLGMNEICLLLGEPFKIDFDLREM
jgi:hypothetical protein